jgi:hypothetical protein
MRLPRRLRAAVLIVLGAVVVLPGSAWLVFHSRGGQEEDFQLRLSRWGGRSQPILDGTHPLYPYRSYLGAENYLVIAGSKGRRVEAGGSKATREQLAELLTVQPIRTVLAGGARNLDDDWVAGIEAPGELEVLVIDDTSVTDRSVDKILQMKKLEILGLVNTAVSDSAVDRLRRLPSLKHLYVGGPNIRAVRLVESRVVDDSGAPAIRAGVTHHVEGRLRVDGLSSKLRYVLARYRSEGSAPVWSLSPHHPQIRVGGLGKLAELSPDLWSFRVNFPGLPPGRSIIDLSIVPDNGGGPMQVFYRVAEIEVELMPPIPAGAGPVGPR